MRECVICVVGERDIMSVCMCVVEEREAYQKQVIQESALKAMGEGPIVHFRIEK